MSEIKISVAGPQDAEELLEIYAPYVRDTAVSFEYTVPSPEEFRQRIIHTLEKYPYLKAEKDGEVIGYAYAWPEKEDEYLTGDSVRFHEHMGYRKVAEFHKCACKFGRWYNMVWMEKHIGVHSDNPAEIKIFDEVRGMLK